jgi:hypothetical protein
MLKWIKALDLDMWAETVQARNKMPELVADLIWATSTNVRYLRFPSGDKGQVRGFDGELDAASSSSFVPDGMSVWEFGNSGAGKTKAEGDYTKRTKEVDQARRSELTLVIVTPRTWDTPSEKLTDWLAAKNDLHEWKKVEYIDGPRLEDWLAQCPAVASRWASCELKLAPQQGVQSTEEFWQSYSTRFAPPLAESVLLAGREAQAADLLGKLAQENGRLAFAADSPDEVIAFAIASIRTAPEGVRKALEARTLVVETEEAVRYCVNLSKLIYLPRHDARGLAGRLAGVGVTVVSAGADERSNDHVQLRRPSSRDMGKAFVGMGMSEENGYEMARKCGRSLAVLARQHPGGTAKNPDWLAHADSLIPALLAGSWMGNVELDRSVLSGLTRKDYYDAEDELRKFITMQDAPIERIDDLWAMRASVDAFVYLGDRIGRRHLEAFEAAITTVFSKTAEAHKPPNADEPFPIPSYRGSRASHSESLKNGLMNTLLHMAVLHEQAKFTVAGASPQAYVERIVRGLPGLSSDHRLIASMESQLPLLAEAAPHSFLEALERQLEGDASTIKPIFDEYPGMITPTTFHCGLLWSLEVLAWAPDLLPRAALCLAKLANIDPGGRVSNRPINSLRSIFLSWSPGTAAKTQARLSILESTLKAVPEIAWPLLEQLLPRTGDTTSPTEKPKFREYELKDSETLTYRLVWESEAKIVALAVGYAELDPDRWSKLIESLANVQEGAFSLIVDRLNEVLGVAEKENQSIIWSALRREVKRHRKYYDADWAMSPESIERLDRLIEKHKPTAFMETICWLFDDWMPLIEIEEDSDDPTKAIADARVNALRQVIAIAGVQGIIQLMERVKVPRLVVFSVRGLGLTYDQLFELFNIQLSSAIEELALAAGLVLADGKSRFGDKWAASARETLQKSEREPRIIALILLGLEEQRGNWDYVALFGEEIERIYWQQKSPVRITGELEDLLFVMDRYSAVGRSAAAICAASQRLSELAIDKIESLLTTAVIEHNANPDAGGMSGFMDINRVFGELSQRKDTTPERLASLEFMYLPLLRSESLTVHRLLLEQPVQFMAIVRKVFRAKGEDPRNISELEQKQATASYRLLKGLKSLPGQTGQDVDEVVLEAWCVEVRRLAEESNRQAITDQLIGQILAHAPTSAQDQAWPHEAVRNVIEVLASTEVERGISIERVNMRGVYSKGPEEGGDQERALANQSREWAEATAASVRTSAMLLRIAESWEAHAEREDIEAAQRATRW